MKKSAIKATLVFVFVIGAMAVIQSCGSSSSSGTSSTTTTTSSSTSNFTLKGAASTN